MHAYRFARRTIALLEAMPEYSLKPQRDGRFQLAYRIKDAVVPGRAIVWRNCTEEGARRILESLAKEEGVQLSNVLR